MESLEESVLRFLIAKFKKIGISALTLVAYLDWNQTRLDNVVAEIPGNFGVTLGPNEILDCVTIGDIIRLIEKKKNPREVSDE